MQGLRKFDILVKKQKEFIMGLFSGLMGNASQKSNEAVEQELELVLIEGEQVQLAYSLVRDLIVLRIIV